MATIRKIMTPVVKSKNFTLAQARAAYREMKREQLSRANQKTKSRQKSN